MIRKEALESVKANVENANLVKHMLATEAIMRSLARRFGERKSNDLMFDELKEKVAEVFKIGDCQKVKGIYEAILSANEVARKI